MLLVFYHICCFFCFRSDTIGVIQMSVLFVGHFVKEVVWGLTKFFCYFIFFFRNRTTLVERVWYCSLFK